jgi:two-component system nitrate/nitrite response regulator NarL
VNTIAICDMEPVAIEGLRSLIAAAAGIRVLAAEDSLAAVVDAARELQPDVVVLDKAFGIQPVIDTLRDLCLPDSGVKTIVWGAALSDAEALRLLHAGAMGVVRKTAPLECLLDCITTVAAGSTWMEPGLIQSGQLPVRHGRAPLTARELQVMDLVERGLTNRGIGDELGIRTGTVKIHLKHIFEKTGIRGRYGLALSGLKEKGILLGPTVM